MLYMKIFTSVFLIIGLLSFCQPSFANEAQLTVAVLDFKDNSPLSSEELKPMQQGLADMMITTLSQVGALQIVERSQLDAIMEEMALAQSGMIDESTAQKVGNIVGAHYLVLGSFMKGFKDDIRIDCRIVQTETAVTLKAEEVSGDLEDILQLMNKLGRKVIENLDVKLNSKEKKSIEQLEKSCSYNVLRDYFKALNLIQKKKFRKADGLLGEVIRQCPDFRRAVIVRKQMRARVVKMLQERKLNKK
ncbi:hypothetical protein GF337_02450 [candidate division KSB1 bacterium]|nr:hypothetical protein [candidate division KSB1 bacterium]